MEKSISTSYTAKGLKLKKSGVLYELNRNKILFLMIAPAVIYFLVFAYVPMAGIIVAFKNYNYRGGIFFSPWSGFDNFKFFFSSGQAWVVTRNTFLYNIAFIVIGNALQVGVAIFMSEIQSKLYKKVAQAFMFLPYFVSWVVVGMLAYNIFNSQYGLLNHLLASLGIDPINVYNTPGAWKYILVALQSWKYLGYGVIMFQAAIMGIDSECYEAAEIDGATTLQRIFKITIPLIMPTIVILTLLALGRVLRGDFQMFYQLIGDNGILYNATDVIDTFVFRSLINSSNIGMSSAAAFYQSVLCFIFIIVVNALVKRYESEYALF